PQAYLRWLRSLGVRYVVLTDAPPDYSAKAEAAIVGGPHSPLRPVFRARQLTVYAVPRPEPIFSGPGTVLELDESHVVVDVRRAGTARIAVRWSRYWRPSLGCLVRGRDGMLRLSVPHPGRVRLTFSPDAARALGALTGQPARSCAG